MTGLSPRLNLILNTALFCLWGMGFGMLSYYMSPTLGNYCNTKTWENDAGVMVCRIYKTLFTFTFLGLYVAILLFSASHYSLPNTSTALDRSNPPNGILRVA